MYAYKNYMINKYNFVHVSCFCFILTFSWEQKTWSSRSCKHLKLSCFELLALGTWSLPLPVEPAHWKRSWSLAGFWRLSGCWRSCCHLQIFGQRPSCGIVATMILIVLMCKSCVKRVNAVCHAKLMMRHAAFSCQKRQADSQWRHVSGAVLIWNFGWHIRQCFLICLGSDGEIEQALDEDFTPPGSKQHFFLGMTKHETLDGSNQHTLHSEKKHVAMRPWYHDSWRSVVWQDANLAMINCVGLRATWTTKFQ